MTNQPTTKTVEYYRVDVRVRGDKSKKLVESNLFARSASAVQYQIDLIGTPYAGTIVPVFS